jgi:hypothetical protein
VSRVDDIGDRDGWRCWLCDQPVDREMNVNDPRGPSVDSMTTRAKAKARSKGGSKAGSSGAANGVVERLAHRACNTRKGAVAPVVPWAEHLFVVDPAPIIATVETLERKGGRAVVARCPGRDDADAAAAWLTDRLTRLSPESGLEAEVDAGGGQFLVVLRGS